MNNADTPTKAGHTTFSIEGNTLVTTTKETFTIERDWSMPDPAGVCGVATVRVGSRRFVSRYWQPAGAERLYQNLNAASSKSEADMFFRDLKAGTIQMYAESGLTPQPKGK